jgi:hypothetical protein
MPEEPERNVWVSAIALRTAAGRSWVRPITARRTLFARSSSRSARSVSCRIAMSASTSRLGRFQFSIEKV